MGEIFTDRFTGGRSLRVSWRDLKQPSLLPFQSGSNNELLVIDDQENQWNFNCSLNPGRNLVISGSGWNNFSASRLSPGVEVNLYKDEDGNYKISVSS